MRCARLVVLLLSPVLLAGPARAGLFGRSKVSARWAAKPMTVNGDDTDWDEASAFEQDGLSVLAMNDASALYLMITAHTRESRDQLSGESRQDVSLWFVGVDGKIRTWGARIPFSHRDALTAALRSPAGLDPEPEFLQFQGASISTASLPGDVLDRLSATGRRPVWELKIPLKRLAVGPERTVAFDFVVNAPLGGVKRRKVLQTPEGPDDRRSERGRGRDGDSASSHPEESEWDALSYTLSVRLAPDPAAPR